MNVKVQGREQHYRTVTFEARRNEVCLIDQRKLPHQFRLLKTKTYEATAMAIQDMTVRGAGAIGATAAYGLAQGLKSYQGRSISAFERHKHRVFETLKNARPTAIDPVNVMRRILSSLEGVDSIEDQQSVAMAMAEEFANEDVEHCRALGVHGQKLIRSGMRILTHCNAGWLAFVDIGSATAPLYAAKAKGKSFHVYTDETRPRCQGSTLTAWELHNEGISHQIIADNAAGHLMQRGGIELVIVGSDRVLGRTGEVANKIGTYTKAVLAHRHRIPFYVAIPLSTIDWELKSGRAIPIEERDEAEVLGAYGRSRTKLREWVRIANPGSGAYNPGFDVTPAELITGIITPKGIVKPTELWNSRKELCESRVPFHENS